jgi:pimeloyl-ACP methyl ester carboxylesterase
MNTDISRPSLWLHLTEIVRSLKERREAQHYIRQYPTIPMGHDDIVYIIPGFMASDFSTALLRDWLDTLGFKSVDWGLGRNYGKLSDIELIQKHITDLVNEHQRPVTLIGWSLGGIYARRLAQVIPTAMTKVITLGSPYKDIKAPNYASWLFTLLGKVRGKPSSDPEWAKDLCLPINVPSYAFYSKEDGIVPWQACMDPDDATDHHNIEVSGSHFGLGMNKEVLGHLINILAHPVQATKSSLAYYDMATVAQ